MKTKKTLKPTARWETAPITLFVKSPGLQVKISVLMHDLLGYHDCGPYKFDKNFVLVPKYRNHKKYYLPIDDLAAMLD